LIFTNTFLLYHIDSALSKVKTGKASAIRIKHKKYYVNYQLFNVYRKLTIDKRKFICYTLIKISAYNILITKNKMEVIV